MSRQYICKNYIAIKPNIVKLTIIYERKTANVPYVDGKDIFGGFLSADKL
jgi:hypothetical protein